MADVAVGLLRGQFWSPDHDAKIRFFVADGRVCGRIVWMERAGRDINNPDPARKVRSLIGLEIISGFVAQPDGRSWKGGTVYDPDTGNTYNGRMWFAEGDDDRLRLRGAIMWGLLGRTEELARIQPNE